MTSRKYRWLYFSQALYMTCVNFFFYKKMAMVKKFICISYDYRVRFYPGSES